MKFLLGGIVIKNNFQTLVFWQKKLLATLASSVYSVCAKKDPTVLYSATSNIIQMYDKQTLKINFNSSVDYTWDFIKTDLNFVFTKRIYKFTKSSPRENYPLFKKTFVFKKFI